MVPELRRCKVGAADATEARAAMRVMALANIVISFVVEVKKL